MSQYALNIGVTVPTIKRWISILEASYVVFLLPPYYENLGKRLVKRPKLYFYDTGLVSYLAGVKTEELFCNGPLAGPIFENYIVSEIMKKEQHSGQPADLYYFRTQDGVEIDLIVDRKSSKEWIEIKKNSTFRKRMIASVARLKNLEDHGYLIYTGENIRLDNHLNVVNYGDFLK